MMRFSPRTSRTFHVRVGSGVDPVGHKLHRPDPGSHADGELNQAGHLSFKWADELAEGMVAVLILNAINKNPS